MKIYTVMVASNFMKGHPKAGEPTDFRRKIQTGQKIHTCRQNFDHWQARADEINAEKAKLELRQWSGKPYRSAQITIGTLYKVGIQRLVTNGMGLFSVDGVIVDPAVLAKNDGLTPMDLLDWFTYPIPNGAIIHFNSNFHYGNGKFAKLNFPE
jgi:hypothetical protein